MSDEKEFNSVSEDELAVQSESVGEPNESNEELKTRGAAVTAFEWLDSFVISLVAVIILFTFFLGKVRVDGPSMEETLHSDDQLIVSDFMYRPSVGDIVIVSRNHENVVLETEDTSIEPIVKRVIAVEGQTVEIKDGKVFVDNKEIKENYIKTPTDNKQFSGIQEVPKGRIFVMGDNRYDSHDSRSQDIGFVDTRFVLGKVLVRIFPFDKITVFN